jgi:hypothetical protein
VINLPKIRYYAALCLSAVFALLPLSSLGMGAPRGAIGWIAFFFLLALPAAIWLTRDGKMAPYLQCLALAIAVLSVASFSFVASYS